MKIWCLPYAWPQRVSKSRPVVDSTLCPTYFCVILLPPSFSLSLDFRRIVEFQGVYLDDCNKGWLARSLVLERRFLFFDEEKHRCLEEDTRWFDERDIVIWEIVKLFGIQTRLCANKRNFSSWLPCGPFCQTNFQDRPLTNHSLSATTQPAASRISIGYLQLIPCPFAIRFRSIGHSFVLCLGAVSLIPVIYVSSILRFLVTSSTTTNPL